MAKISGSDIRPGMVVEHDGSRAAPPSAVATAASSYKSATLENGLRLLVPPFVSAGEKAVVSTDDAAYVRRAD